MPRRLSNFWIVPVAAATMAVLYTIDQAASWQADARAAAEASAAAGCEAARRPSQVRDSKAVPPARPESGAGSHSC